MVHGSLFEFALEFFPTGRRSLATTCLLWSMPRVQKVTLVPVGTIEFRFGVVHVCIDNGRVIQSSKYESTLDRLAQHSWQQTDQPAWLTPELFTAKIQPLLSNVPMSAIRSALGVSKWYASKIRQGYRPHPRHWSALAEVAGVYVRKSGGLNAAGSQ